MNISAFGGSNAFHASLPKETGAMQKQQAEQAVPSTGAKLPQASVVSPSQQGAKTAQNEQQGSNMANSPRTPRNDNVFPKGAKDCETCENRTYQDGSNDASVSFKTPTNIDPDAAASAVRGHEQEHVSNEQAKAQREQREIISQTVTMHTGICSECGRAYVSGGTTRTVSRAKTEAVAEQYSTTGEKSKAGFAASA